MTGRPSRSVKAFDGPPAAALQEALNASDDMKSIWACSMRPLEPNEQRTSGRAILARQREGDVSTFNYIDNLSRAIRHAGRVMVDLIPHVYNTERIIRTIRKTAQTAKCRSTSQLPPNSRRPQAIKLPTAPRCFAGL